VPVGLTLDPTTVTKLEFRSQLCVFLGYSLHYKGCHCLHIPTGQIYISRNVIFDETSFSFQHLLVPAPSSLSQPASLPSSLSISSPPHVPPTSPPCHTPPLLPTQRTSIHSVSPPTPSHATNPIEPPIPPIDPCPLPISTVIPHVSHPMQTRSKSQIHKPRAFTVGTIPYPPPKAHLTLKLPPNEEPTSFTTAISLPNGE